MRNENCTHLKENTISGNIVFFVVVFFSKSKGLLLKDKKSKLFPLREITTLKRNAIDENQVAHVLVHVASL